MSSKQGPRTKHDVEDEEQIDEKQSRRREQKQTIYILNCKLFSKFELIHLSLLELFHSCPQDSSRFCDQNFELVNQIEKKREKRSGKKLDWFETSNNKNKIFQFPTTATTTELTNHEAKFNFPSSLPNQTSKVDLMASIGSKQEFQLFIFSFDTAWQIYEWQSVFSSKISMRTRQEWIGSFAQRRWRSFKKSGRGEKEQQNWRICFWEEEKSSVYLFTPSLAPGLKVKVQVEANK